MNMPEFSSLDLRLFQAFQMKTAAEAFKIDKKVFKFIQLLAACVKFLYALHFTNNLLFKNHRWITKNVMKFVAANDKFYCHNLYDSLWVLISMHTIQIRYSTSASQQSDIDKRS